MENIASAFAPLPDDTTNADYRVAPHNIEAEQALIGAVLVNN